jgi:tRNA threonylcarbamoyladenosine biosynthesis protein TsaB
LAKPGSQLALALDAAGVACSAAVAAGETLLSTERAENWHAQAETLLPLVDAAMLKAGTRPQDLDLIATTVGPGSFTGVRVALAAARGIAIATHARLVGVTSFAAAAARLTQPVEADRFLLIALESRREDLYVQLFDCRHNPVGDPAAVLPIALCDAVDAAIGARPIMIAGDAAERAAAALAESRETAVLADSAPDAVGALFAALRLRRRGEHGDTARPLYLRPPDVTLSSRHPKPGVNRA